MVRRILGWLSHMWRRVGITTRDYPQSDLELGDLDDVRISGITDSEMLVYDSITRRWENGGDGLTYDDATGTLETGTGVMTSGLVLPKTSGTGIKVDTAVPTFGWRDIIGDLTPKTTGENRAVQAAFRGGSYRAWFYDPGDINDMVFHIPHDYTPGSDLFLHLHWAHIGTAISGNLVVDFGITYSKGHNQAIFPAEVATSLSVATPDITTIPQYRHRIDEIQISAAGGSLTQLDSSLIEVDGLILIGLSVNAIPTITGGSTNLPAFLLLDLHYQSTNIATKQKAPPFWT